MERSELLACIENAERYFLRKPLNQVRVREGLPEVTLEEITQRAKLERRIGPFISDVKRVKK